MLLNTPNAPYRVSAKAPEASDWPKCPIQYSGMKVLNPTMSAERQMILTVSLENSFQLLSGRELPEAASRTWPPDGSWFSRGMRTIRMNIRDAMLAATSARTDVPRRPKACTSATASIGPSTYPVFPPTEKMLNPVPWALPETLLAKRAPSG